MSLLDRLITLDLLDVSPALAKVANPEQVQEAVLRELANALEVAGAEAGQLQRSRDTLLQNRREAEKESDAKQASINTAAESDKENLKKQAAALDEALVRLDEQIAEQNQEEATLHKYVTRLQEIRREASEWSPRRHARSEPKVEAVKEPSQEKEQANKANSSESSSSVSKTEAAPAKVQEKADSKDPFYKMTRLKEKMDAFQARTAIDEEELQAFLTEKAIAEEETRMVIEQNLSELKKKMSSRE